MKQNQDIKDKVEKELKRKRGPQKQSVVEDKVETKTKFTKEFSDGSVWTYDLKKNSNGPIQVTNK